jgi:transposase
LPLAERLSTAASTCRDLVMRQTHRAGETLFVDYAGQTVPVIDRTTGEVRQAQVFVAVLGASNYTYAEASWSQGLPDWIQAHVRAFAFLGGVPECLVPDNLKAGVTQPHHLGHPLSLPGCCCACSR